MSVVETEPALAALVLREANLMGEGPPTTQLRDACLLLGEDRLREVFAKVGATAAPDQWRERLWEHSLRAAEAARLLADGTSIMNADEAYTLGLLHDVGEILLGELFPDEVGRAVGETGERIEEEATLFGVDHAQVGQWLLEACALPRHLTAAMQTHHDAERVNSPTALLLHAADAIARAASPYEVAALETIDTDRLYMLGLSRNELFRVHACVGSAVERRLDPVL